MAKSQTATLARACEQLYTMSRIAMVNNFCVVGWDQYGKTTPTRIPVSGIFYSPNFLSGRIEYPIRPQDVYPSASFVSPSSLIFGYFVSPSSLHAFMHHVHNFPACFHASSACMHAFLHACVPACFHASSA